MESLLEVLFPLIIAGVYFFGNILSKKKDKSAAPRPVNQEEASSAERDVQEQIRRKIEARRASYEISERELLPKTEPNKSYIPEDPVRKQVQESPDLSTVTSAQGSIGQNNENAWGFTEVENNYAKEIQNRRQKLEDTKRQVKDLRKMSKQGAYSMNQAKPKLSNGSSNTKGRYIGPIRTRLRTLNAAREGFIYSEVLGAPVALRKGSTLPN